MTESVQFALMGIGENRMALRLLAAIAAAEDRLCELVDRPDDDPAILMLRAAMAEAKRSLPPTIHAEPPLLQAEWRIS